MNYLKIVLVVSLLGNSYLSVKYFFSKEDEVKSNEVRDIKFQNNDLIVRVENFGKRIKVNVQNDERMFLDALYSEGSDSHDRLMIIEKLVPNGYMLKFISPKGEIIGEEILNVPSKIKKNPNHK
jgi:hypothetical protein